MPQVIKSSLNLRCKAEQTKNQKPKKEILKRKASYIILKLFNNSDRLMSASRPSKEWHVFQLIIFLKELVLTKGILGLVLFIIKSFRAILGSLQSWAEGTEFSICLPPLYRHSLHYHHPHQSGTFVTMHEPIFTYHNHPKSIVSITVHS